MKSNNDNARALRLERLEDRQMLSANSIFSSHGDLHREERFRDDSTSRVESSHRDHSRSERSGQDLSRNIRQSHDRNGRDQARDSDRSRPNGVRPQVNDMRLQIGDSRPAISTPRFDNVQVVDQVFHEPVARNVQSFAQVESVPVRLASVLSTPTLGRSLPFPFTADSSAARNGTTVVSQPRSDETNAADLVRQSAMAFVPETDSSETFVSIISPSSAINLSDRISELPIATADSDVSEFLVPDPIDVRKWLRESQKAVDQIQRLDEMLEGLAEGNSVCDRETNDRVGDRVDDWGVIEVVKRRPTNWLSQTNNSLIASIVGSANEFVPSQVDEVLSDVTSAGWAIGIGMHQSFLSPGDTPELLFADGPVDGAVQVDIATWKTEAYDEEKQQVSRSEEVGSSIEAASPIVAAVSIATGLWCSGVLKPRQERNTTLTAARNES